MAWWRVGVRGGLFAFLSVVMVTWADLALAAAPVSLSALPFGSVEITKWHADIDVSSDGSYVEATEVIRATGRHGDATPDLEQTARGVRREVLDRMRRGVVPVVPGFIASGPYSKK